MFAAIIFLEFLSVQPAGMTGTMGRFMEEGGIIWSIGVRKSLFRHGCLTGLFEIAWTVTLMNNNRFREYRGFPAFIKVQYNPD